VDFQSADPSVVKSIRQRDLLNGWLRLYARQSALPYIADYQPDRLAEELPDLVYYIVEQDRQPARFVIDSNGTRMSNAYGSTGRGRYLDEYLGPILGPVVLPVYAECVRRALPVYTISVVDDVHGRAVAYERVLMPFSDGAGVSHIIASLKAISEDGGFEIRNLMRGHRSMPTPNVRAVIDHNLFHRPPNYIAAGDIVEIV
jgi:hypothetical protein